MMPLAMISPIEIGVLLIVCWVGYKVVNRCGAKCGGVRPVAGFVLKSLGVVAVVAGLVVLLTRSGRYEETDVRAVHVREVVGRDAARIREEIHGDVARLHEELRGDLSHLREEIAGDVGFHEGFERGDFVRPFHDDGLENFDRAPKPGMLIVLGSGLIILGAILFGRERTRPFALKAITFLGVGAILFSVVNYFADPPRAERTAQRIVRHARQEVSEHEVRRPTEVARTSRARRPSMRPERPAPGASASVELPPRAGEIPVTVEVADDLKAEVAAAKTPAAEDVAEAEAPPEAPAEPAPPAALEPPAATKSEETAAAEPETETKPAPVSVAKPDETAAAAAKPEVAAAATSVDSKDRPAWVGATPGLKGEIYSLTVNSGPWTSVPECQHALNEEILSAANRYINDYIGDEQAAKLVNVSLPYLDAHVKKAQYAEVVQSPAVGPMHQLHARLEFNDQVRADFQRRWRNAVVQGRLWYTGGGAALVLALLATFYGYLRLDLKTDTAHKGRLQLAATLVALIVAAGALLARWAVPF